MKKFLAIPAIVATLVLFAGLVVAAGCKQGEGERCQLNSDCESGLVCNQATQECASLGSNSEPIDADVAVDGPPIDVLDAPPDAPDAR